MVFSTQQAIEIAGIKDGIILMKDGSYRIVLEVAATNFALKSEEEQNSLVFQYQGFINSLHFPIEIVIRSRQLDLSPYIAKIEQLQSGEKNELVKMQITDYVDFLKKLIDMANIMKKTFYVVVSYNPLTVKKMGFLDKFIKGRSVNEHIKVSETEYKDHTTKLKERANITASGLGGMGLHCLQLSTEELIELFYSIYNPDEASKERVKDAAMLSSSVIVSESEFSGKEEHPVMDAESKGDMIDNTSIVQAQRKQEAEQQRQDDLKASEKEMSAPSAQKQATPVAPPQQPEPAAQQAQPQVSDPAAPTTTPAPTQSSPVLTVPTDEQTGQTPVNN